MRYVIQKFGGACFADLERLALVARKLAEGGERPVVVVVSARQGVTDQLGAQLSSLGMPVASRSGDLLLATGEMQSAALLAATVERLGTRAEVVPPWRVFRTDGVPGDATIRAVKGRPIRRLLQRGILPIVPGFIGATPGGRITTLGRGGSDYSAVALGVALRAERVELYKAEVDGVYDADPHAHAGARRFDTLSHAEALRLARAGARVLQEKAAALAARAALPVLVRAAFHAGRGTAIGGNAVGAACVLAG
jgi:aspartate kinase